MSAEVVPADELVTVTVVSDENGYGMKVSGDNPVYVQSVKEGGAAWRAGLRAGDRLLKVDGVSVHTHTHNRVVLMIRSNPSVVLTVHQNSNRNKTPITAPVPVDSEKQYQLAVAKLRTLRLMLENEEKHVRELKSEVSKVPDVRKQAEIESGEVRINKFKHEMDIIAASLPDTLAASFNAAPSTPKMNRKSLEKNLPGSPPPQQNTGFLSGLPRSLSNLTGQSLRNLRQGKHKNEQPIVMRQHSEEKRRHNNTVPLVPTTCLDNTPPPLPPRSSERPKKPVNPLAKPKPGSSYHHQVPGFHNREEVLRQLKRSSHSLDGEVDGPQPNSIAMQMSYPLVNIPPPPLQTDNRTGVPIMHVRSQSSPEHLDHGLPRNNSSVMTGSMEGWAAPPPPGTPPPPYVINTTPCADPQRAIISMEEDDSPHSDNSTYSGLFCNLRSVRESKARSAVLLNWLLGERRDACAHLLLILTDGFRAAPPTAATSATLRRWAYEIQSTFLMPDAVLKFNGVDENMANEIEQVLAKEYDKEEILRNVFRKARQKAKEELAVQLSAFQVKRQVGLGTLYAPDDSVIEKCVADKAQEQSVVERLLVPCVSAAAAGGAHCSPREHALLAALVAAALQLNCRPASIASAVGVSRGTFLQREKPYKQRVKLLAKQHPQPYIVRGHHLQLEALTSVAHCHYCDLVIWGVAPQAYICSACKLRVHRACAKNVEEPCCLDSEHHNNRISRFMERIHNQANQENEKKSKKASGTSHFLNMERSFRKMEDEPAAVSDHPANISAVRRPLLDEGLPTPTPSLPIRCHLHPPAASYPPDVIERRDGSVDSLYESADQCDVTPCELTVNEDQLPGQQTIAANNDPLKLKVPEDITNARPKKGHRKTLSLSNPLEMMKSIGDEWIDHSRLDKGKVKSQENLLKQDEELPKEIVEAKKEIKINKNFSMRKSNPEVPKSRKTSKVTSVSALNFLRRKKPIIPEVEPKLHPDKILIQTAQFIDEERKYSSQCDLENDLEEVTDSEEDVRRKVGTRRRLSRQTSRGKRGKSQAVKVNTLRKSHSGTLKKGKKKGCKTPVAARSRQTSIADASTVLKKKSSDGIRHNSWLFSRGEARRDGSAEEQTPLEGDGDTHDAKEIDRDSGVSSAGGGGAGTTTGAGRGGVSRAESCRERDAPRRGKHRNASDPNRLTPHNHARDLEAGAPTAPSGSSSSSSLSSRSNESNTVTAEQQASQSEWSDEEEALPPAWADSLPPHVLHTLQLSSAHRKRQEIIHELIVSEGSHVRWLKVLNSVFLKPLESQSSLLPPDELRALFPNLPQVRERHSRLYGELRRARADAHDHTVCAGAVADVMLHALGDPGYASCLARFCRNQRHALETLRARRKRNKELHALLCAREQLPLCARLQLRDLLACVWQRLTKYQLLLEGIVKSFSAEECGTGTGAGVGGGGEADRARRALGVAKDVLLSVDTAIRTAENEHRLRTIQSKLEVRCVGPEWEELRRLDLTKHTLTLESELTLRTDSKRIPLLGVMVESALVLLCRDGDKFVLRPLAHQLSPIVKWDKVLFRPNAAVRNSFFLMNINGVQMHELSANTAADYATWVKHIGEAPLAKLTELKPSGTPAHARQQDHASTNVSRNPSDASEKSTNSEETSEDTSPETQRSDVERGEVERSEVERSEVEPSEGKEEKLDERQSVERNGPIVSSNGSRGVAREPELFAASAVEPPPVHIAHKVYTQQEQLRRVDADIKRALERKCELVCESLGLHTEDYSHLAELAVADTLGHVDVSAGSPWSPPCAPPTELSLHSLLLAAHAQAQQLTEALSGALHVRESTVQCRRAGLCDSCLYTGSQTLTPSKSRTHHTTPDRVLNTQDLSPNDQLTGERIPTPQDRVSTPQNRVLTPQNRDLTPQNRDLTPQDRVLTPQDRVLTPQDRVLQDQALQKETSFDMLSDLEGPNQGMRSFEDVSEVELAARRQVTDAALARRLVPLATSLQAALSRALAAATMGESSHTATRAARAAARENADRGRHRSHAERNLNDALSTMQHPLDHSLPDQDSNG